MKYLFLLLLTFQAHAALKVSGNDVVPFNNPKYPIKELIKDYAETMKLNVTYVSNLLKDETVHIELNSKTSLAEFKKIFYEALYTLGYSPKEDQGILWIYATRDSRYLMSQIYTDDSFPKDASFGLVVHKLKYPLSGEIARNLRPFMSRYGRVIDLNDARTILIHDRGDNAERLIKTINTMDTEEAYKNVLAYKPGKDEHEGNPLKEKVVELELEKKLLEKKYMQLKEERP